MSVWAISGAAMHCRPLLTASACWAVRGRATHTPQGGYVGVCCSKENSAAPCRPLGRDVCFDRSTVIKRFKLQSHQVVSLVAFCCLQDLFHFRFCQDRREKNPLLGFCCGQLLPVLYNCNFSSTSLYWHTPLYKEDIVPLTQKSWCRIRGASSCKHSFSFSESHV